MQVVTSRLTVYYYERVVDIVKSPVSLAKREGHRATYQIDLKNRQPFLLVLNTCSNFYTNPQSVWEFAFQLQISFNVMNFRYGIHIHGILLDILPERINLLKFIQRQTTIMQINNI